MPTQTTTQELSVEQRRLLLKQVAASIETKHKDIQHIFEEPLYSMFDDKYDGQSPAIYGLFMQSLLLLMTVPENSAFMQKNFGTETLICFDKLLFFFKYLGDQPIHQWVDYTRCTHFTGGLDAEDLERLCDDYLK